MGEPKKGTRPTASSTDQTTQYANDVVAGKIIAGPHVRDACKRHLRDLKEGPKRGLTWDLEAAIKEIAFYPEVLCLNGGQFEGKPFDLDGWQAFCIGSVFGWKKPDGSRRFRTAYIETGKGSGKSPLAAGVGLKLLCADGEQRAEIYAAAVKQDQAKVLFRDAVAMVQQSPNLRRRLNLTGGKTPDNIAHLASASFFRPISSERQGRGQSGPRPHGALLDEIHEHPTNATVEFMNAGFKCRRQPLMWMITNSGSNRHTVCWHYHQYGATVCAGTIEDDEFFAYICALDKGDDPLTDEACWPKANPSLPTIPGYAYLRTEVRKARGMPSKEGLCRRLNFCQWTDAVDAWITKDVWFACQAKFDIEEYKGRVCYGGLDLSLSSDLTALVLLFPGKDRRFDAFSFFWMPGDRLLELETKDGMAPNYQLWRDAGRLQPHSGLQAPSGKTIDYVHAAHFIAKICEWFDVKGIAYDRAKIELLRPELDQIGCTVKLIEHPQGFFHSKESGLWMPASIDALEASIIEGRLRCHENPVLSYCVASAVTKSSNLEPTDRYFSKRAATGRIDGAVALAQAMGAATLQLLQPKSFWES